MSEVKELLQVYRFALAEVGRGRKNERLMKDVAETLSQANVLVSDARVEIATLEGELSEARNEAARNRSEAQRCKALDVILASERDDADEAALWLEAIAILAEPAPVLPHMAEDHLQMPVACLKCGGPKCGGGSLCWPCYGEDSQLGSELIRQWLIGRRDFPLKTP